jgi:Mg-chelatase subunit ChlD
MLVFVVLLMVGFIAASAFMVGVAHMQLARTELRSATDAAARAAAQALASTQDVDAAVTAGRQSGLLNLVNNEPLQLTATDFEFGHSELDSQGRFLFRLNQTPINSVRVVGRRTAGSASGTIPLFMGSMLGRGNFEPVQSSIATYIERDVVLVVDRSGSMRGQKFTDLQAAVGTFTATLNGTPVDEVVGLASYSTSGRIDVAMTENLSEIDAAMAAMTATGMTSISDGMEHGRQIMENSRSSRYVEKTMIVMTDGIHNTGPEPSGVASVLASEGVTIHAITFGSNADRSRMQNIAAIGGGRYYHADSGTQLADIYREIALTLSTMLTE